MEHSAGLSDGLGIGVVVLPPATLGHVARCHLLYATRSHPTGFLVERPATARRKPRVPEVQYRTRSPPPFPMDLVNQRVRKRFGKRWYLGTVREVWRDDGNGKELLAHIDYDDGDAEDLALDDARALLVDASVPGQAKAQVAGAKHGAPRLLTDAYQRLPPKRAANPVETTPRCGGWRGPSAASMLASGKQFSRLDSFPPPLFSAKRTKAQSSAPRAAVQKLSPEELAAAKAAKAAAEAAKAEAEAEARRVETERGYSAVTTGSVHVTTLRVLFDVRPDVRQFPGSTEELLSKLGPAPALHTLLRIVPVDVTRLFTAQQQAEKALELERKLKGRASLDTSILSAAQELKEFLLKHSLRFKAALAASAGAAAACEPVSEGSGPGGAAASEPVAEGSGQRLYTAADFSPGDVVRAAVIDYASIMKTSLALVKCIDRVDAQNVSVLVVGPVTLDGKPIMHVAPWGRNFKPEELVLEAEERKRLIGEVLSGWDVGDVSQYADMHVKTGVARKPAYARLWQVKVMRDGKEEPCMDPSIHQTLALRLEDESWPLQLNGKGPPIPWVWLSRTSLSSMSLGTACRGTACRQTCRSGCPPPKWRVMKKATASRLNTAS